MQPRDVIFKLREPNSGLFDTDADSVGKMKLLPVLWAHFRYLFLWEDSPKPDSIDVWRRLHRRLETPPTSVFKVEGGTFSVKLPFWGQFSYKHVVSNETLVCPDRDKMLVINKTGHLFEVPLGTICLSYF